MKLLLLSEINVRPGERFERQLVLSSSGTFSVWVEMWTKIRLFCISICWDSLLKKDVILPGSSQLSPHAVSDSGFHLTGKLLCHFYSLHQ